MMTSKIAEQHLLRVACIYIRQSTLGQVRFNQESTERQYNLKNKAQSLGWSPEKIRILDRDLGHSGAHATNREDFKTLVSDVAMGQVGAIFSLEASRLARSNKDWHRLLELCAITRTLVIDEDGCYDPSEFNDSLVLGMHMIVTGGTGVELPAAALIGALGRSPSPAKQRGSELSHSPILDGRGAVPDLLPLPTA